MVLRPPRSTLPHTPFPYRPLFRSALRGPISYSCRAREFLESADDRALVIELAISTTRFRRAVARRTATASQRRVRVAAAARTAALRRSAERRVGKEGVSTCRYRWSASHYQNKLNKINLNTYQS